jgi:5-methylcytosine-specific restriction endonuclease McrA
VTPPLITPPPSAEAQLTFLSKLQRLFAESSFTATYKFALLIALADLAVECGQDDGAPLPLTIRQIAERFIGLYWRHATPYGSAPAGATAAPHVLLQNLGTQAAVVTAIEDFRRSTRANHPLQARNTPAYGDLLGKVAAVVSKQPLHYLQNFGGGTDEFLYHRHAPGKVTLQPGVAYCLRRFYPLVQQLSRNHWVAHVKGNRLNLPMLGDSADLEDFLFSTSRQSLQLIGSQLRKLDGERCFYCGHTLSLQQVDVDHFVPFSLYPRDLIGNFVLAHPACNRSKSDTLAAKPHLERWLDRITRQADSLQEIGLSTGVPAEADTLRRVAAWGYQSAVGSGGRAWVKREEYEVVDGGYLRVLGVDFDEYRHSELA